MRSSTPVGASLKTWYGLSLSWETLIELLGHRIKKQGVSRRRGVGVASESNSAIAINRGSKGQGYGAVGLFKHSGHDVWKGGSHDERIITGGCGSARGEETRLCSWER